MRRTLRARIACGMFIYASLIATGVLMLGYVTNESVERVVWQSLLNGELDHFVEQRALDPEYSSPASSNLRAYATERAASSADIPSALLALPPGLHDDIVVAGRLVAVMVRDVGAQRLYMLIDITEHEAEEWSLTTGLVALAVVLTVLFGALGWWISGRLLRPLSEFSADLDRLSPSTRGTRVAFDAGANDEIAAIGLAVNRLLDRIDGFVAREREFVNSASHELRTPIATILGAAELASAHPDLTEALRRPLARIQRASREIDQLINVLLVLAKSPERIMASATAFSLDELVADVVEDHRPMTAAKSLSVCTALLTPSTIRAPLRIAQIAVANLVRNAVEHSDRGRITLSIEPAGVVRVQDPGHGMAAAEIGELYAALARQGESQGGRGIGLELMARICEHLDWVLRIEATEDGSTVATLDLRASLVSS